ncbi:hypothetical protein [Novosphingobium sp. Chol11]|uniref:hypothetical protein n=1 Tax=Novosphingobium sp. Chol11 TaxID=1385763 RepID=UPI000BE249EA|nr:hypothetical protein [Novosphingobium sp. Chol11]
MRPINGDEAGKLLKKRLSQISGAVAQINLSFSSRQGEPLKIEKKAEAIASLFACVARLQKRIPIALLTNRGHDASSIYTDFLKKMGTGHFHRSNPH